MKAVHREARIDGLDDDLSNPFDVLPFCAVTLVCSSECTLIFGQIRSFFGEAWTSLLTLGKPDTFFWTTRYIVKYVRYAQCNALCDTTVRLAQPLLSTRY